MRSTIQLFVNKHFLTLAFLSGMVWSSLSQQIESVYSTVDFTIESLDFPTENIGYASINKYLGWEDGYEGGILKTLDGGQNWDILGFPFMGSAGQFIMSGKNIYFFDENNGITTTINTTGSSPNRITTYHTYVTSDGSENWQQNTPEIETITDTGHYDDYFYLLGTKNNKTVIFRYSHIQNIWELILDSETLHFDKIYFLNEVEGFARGNQTGTFFKTTDGGENWSYTGSHETIASSGYLIFIDNLNGISTGEYYGSQFIKTTDGGTTWEEVHSDTENEYTICCQAHFLVKHNDKVYTTAYKYQQPYVLVSSSDTVSWEEDFEFEAALNGSWINDVYFIDESSGFAAVTEYHSSENIEYVIYKLKNTTIGVQHTSIENNIKLYPNPTASTLYLSVPSEITIEAIRLLDIHGKTVKTYPANQQELSLGGLAAGQYFLEIRSNAGQTTKKVVIR